jgi:hypothetical protein
LCSGEPAGCAAVIGVMNANRRDLGAGGLGSQGAFCAFQSKPHASGAAPSQTPGQHPRSVGVSTRVGFSSQGLGLDICVACGAPFTTHRVEASHLEIAASDSEREDARKGKRCRSPAEGMSRSLLGARMRHHPGVVMGTTRHPQCPSITHLAPCSQGPGHQVRGFKAKLTEALKQ